MSYLNLLAAASLLWFPAHRVHAQRCDLVLQGRVLERESGAPLPWASVFITELNQKFVTDEAGHFALTGLCKNTPYVLKINSLQSSDFAKTIQLQGNEIMDFRLEPKSGLEEVVVREKAMAALPIQALAHVDKLDLEAGRGQNLGEALRRLPGVSLLQTGAGISKPMIHGLHSNRVALVVNGVVLEGQQWGLEHAPEMDVFAVEEISVLKGAAGVRYGAGALAGAVLMTPAPLRERAGAGGHLIGQFFSNGLGGVISGAVDGHWAEKKVSYRLQGTAKRLGNLHAPDYFLGNTGQQELNLSSMAKWEKKRWTHEVSASTFNQKIAVMRAGHVGNLSDINLAIGSDKPLNNPNFFTYRIDRPYQRVQHNTLKYSALWRISENWKLSAQHYLQYNKREEFDVVRKTGAAAARPQVSFGLLNNSIDAALEHYPIRHWQGGAGLQFVHFYNQVSRGGFIPNYRAYGASIWAMERWRKHPIPWELEWGARYDFRQTAAATRGNLINLDTLVRFGGISAHVGVLYRLNEHWQISMHSGLVTRSPHVNELFAQGVDFLLANYRKGRPDMANEKAWNSNVNCSFQRERTVLALSVFRNAVYDFIYLNPTGQNVLTVRGAFPEYAHQQTQRAVLQGFDAQMSLPLVRQLALETRASVLRASRRTSENPENPRGRAWLPLMPPDRFQYGLRWTLPHPDTRDERFTLRCMAHSTARQIRLPREGLSKPAPAAFTTLSADAIYKMSWQKKRLEFGLSLQNIGNTRYREYLNFFRFFADEPAFNASIRLKVRWP